MSKFGVVIGAIVLVAVLAALVLLAQAFFLMIGLGLVAAAFNKPGLALGYGQSLVVAFVLSVIGGILRGGNSNGKD